jgi:hypothetical protein
MNLIPLLEFHFDEISNARAEAQTRAVREYVQFREELERNGGAR